MTQEKHLPRHRFCLRLFTSTPVSVLKMGKLNIFEITLTNFNGVYFAGQNLEGHVTVELNDQMKMRGMFCRLKSGDTLPHSP